MALWVAGKAGEGEDGACGHWGGADALSNATGVSRQIMDLNDFELPNDYQPASAIEFSFQHHAAGQKGCSRGSGSFYE